MTNDNDNDNSLLFKVTMPTTVHDSTSWSQTMDQRSGRVVGSGHSVTINSLDLAINRSVALIEEGLI